MGVIAAMVVVMMVTAVIVRMCVLHTAIIARPATAA
jgi:hypothetical protein